MALPRLSFGILQWIGEDHQTQSYQWHRKVLRSNDAYFEGHPTIASRVKNRFNLCLILFSSRMCIVFIFLIKSTKYAKRSSWEENKNRQPKQ